MPTFKEGDRRRQKRWSARASHELPPGVEPRSGLAVGSIGLVYRHFRSETLSTILDSLQQPLAQGWINEVGAGANRHDIGLGPMSPETFGTIEPRGDSLPRIVRKPNVWIVNRLRRHPDNLALAQVSHREVDEVPRVGRLPLRQHVVMLVNVDDKVGKLERVRR